MHIPLLIGCAPVCHTWQFDYQATRTGLPEERRDFLNLQNHQQITQQILQQIHPLLCRNPIDAIAFTLGQQQQQQQYAWHWWKEEGQDAQNQSPACGGRGGNEGCRRGIDVVIEGKGIDGIDVRIKGAKDNKDKEERCKG